MLLDEPCAGVNPSLVDGLRELLVELNKKQGGSFVVIEHNMDFVMKLCHRIVCMVEGKVRLLLAKPEEIRTTAKCWRPILATDNASTAARSESLIQFDAVVAGYTHPHHPQRAHARRAQRRDHAADRSQRCRQVNGAEDLVRHADAALRRVRFGGKVINGRTPRQLLGEGMAFVPQGRNLFGSLSVLHNLELGGLQLLRNCCASASTK